MGAEGQPTCPSLGPCPTWRSVEHCGADEHVHGRQHPVVCSHLLQVQVRAGTAGAGLEQVMALCRQGLTAAAPAPPAHAHPRQQCWQLGGIGRRASAITGGETEAPRGEVRRLALG